MTYILPEHPEPEKWLAQAPYKTCWEADKAVSSLIRSVEHPFIRFLEENARQIGVFMDGYRRTTTPEDEHRYVAANYGAFAESVEELALSERDRFTLDTVNMLAMWKHVTKLELPKYATAAIVLCAYFNAALGFESLRGLGRRTIEEGPQKGLLNGEESRLFYELLRQVKGSAEALSLLNRDKWDYAAQVSENFRTGITLSLSMVGNWKAEGKKIKSAIDIN